jgi:signal transduction histidine kinase/putative methionine-R-sulfoxide reductase with GAF domain
MSTPSTAAPQGNRALALLRACGERIRRAREESVMLQEVCEAAVEAGGYRLAWVGYARQDADRTIKPVAFAGEENEYIARGRFTWALDAHGQGPAGRTIRTGESSLANDVVNDPHFAPWREQALARGFRAVAGFPLRQEGEVIGVLLIYAGQEHAFGDTEVTLLEELAWHISFGIAALRTQAAEQRHQAELELQHQQQQILKNILNIALEPTTLEHKLTCSLGQLADLPWFAKTQGTALFVRDTNSDNLELVASYDMPDAVREGCSSVPLGSCFCGRVGQTGQPEFARHTLPSHQHRVDLETEHGHFALPLPGSEVDPLGVLILHLDPQHTYSEAEDQFLSTVAAMIGHLVERDRATRRLQEMREERGRIRHFLALGEIASAFAHQLRQPLTAAANYLTLAEDRLDQSGADPAQAGEMVAEGHAQVRRVSDIVRNIRSFLGYGQPHLTEASINQVAEELYPLAREILEGLGRYRLRLSLARDLPPSPLDTVLLQEVLLNLVRNAGEAMAGEGVRDGCVTIRTENTEHGIEVSVADQGPGLTAEQQEELVQPFHTTKASGMGLGLAVCQSIIEMHGGQLWAEPPRHVTDNTEIRFRLPFNGPGG